MRLQPEESWEVVLYIICTSHTVFVRCKIFTCQIILSSWYHVMLYYHVKVCAAHFDRGFDTDVPSMFAEFLSEIIVQD